MNINDLSIALIRTQNKIVEIEQQLNDKLNFNWKNIYPIGAVYFSVENTFNPNTHFGGTWEKIEQAFLFGSSENYIIGSTGGEINHNLSVNEIPSHSHNFKLSDDIQTGSTYKAVWSKSSTNSTYTNITENSGGGQAHNNMPPYLVVDIWKRTK